MNREEYLKSWKAYPLWQTDAQAPMGRVKSIEAGSVTIWNAAGEITYILASKSSLSSILGAGDWVGLKLNEKGCIKDIELLAPCLAKGEEALEQAKNTQHKAKTLKAWSDFQSTIRTFFEKRGFLHIETPTLVPCPGYELHLDLFETEFKFGKDRQQLFLPTSPEFHLKKTLAKGLTKIYEVKKVFRNGEYSNHHQPEFTMIEWYRTGAKLVEMWRDAIELIKELQFERLKTNNTLFEETTFKKIYLNKWNYDLKPDLNIGDLKQLCQKENMTIPKEATADDLFHLLWIEILEPALDPKTVTCVKDFPGSQAALARIGESGFAERFEIYFNKMELANAFQELNNPKIQEMRFKEEVKERRDQKKSEVGEDKEFFESLKSGMPPSAGIALGLDRLFMAIENIPNIEDTRLFPFRLE